MAKSLRNGNHLMTQSQANAPLRWFVLIDLLRLITPEVYASYLCYPSADKARRRPVLITIRKELNLLLTAINSVIEADSHE